MVSTLRNAASGPTELTTCPWYVEDALGFWTSPYRFARSMLEKVVPAIRPDIPLSTILHPCVPPRLYGIWS